MSEPDHTPQARPLRLLITAGPTHEPIDSVRFLGNRSSGRLGSELADAAAEAGWEVVTLLGPTPISPSDNRVTVHPFRSTVDLDALLIEHLPWCDVLVMAAAVADFRPVTDAKTLEGKIRRGTKPMTIELTPNPDLLAGCAERRRDNQLLVGFALEPAAEMLESARRKLERKKLDLIVANPLETMDAGFIEATVLGAPGGPLEQGRSTDGRIAKSTFASWLLDLLDPIARERLTRRDAKSPADATA